jgi:hypothetical protein
LPFFIAIYIRAYTKHLGYNKLVQYHYVSLELEGAPDRLIGAGILPGLRQPRGNEILKFLKNANMKMPEQALPNPARSKKRN